MDQPTDHASRERRPGTPARDTKSSMPSQLQANAGACALAMATMTELIGVFTHDLSNPLQTFVMQLELLTESTRQDPVMQRRVRSIVSASQEFQSQVQNLANFAHRGPQDRSGRNYKSAVSGVKKLMTPRLQDRKIHWDCSTIGCSTLVGCTATLELVLVRSLIALAYECPRPTHHPLLLRTHIGPCTQTSSPGTKAIRIAFELRQEAASPAQDPILIPIELPQLVTQLQQAAPQVRVTSLATGQLQIDITLPEGV